MPTSERSLNWDDKPPLCGKPAAFRTWAMCVHEHYGEALVCAECLPLTEPDDPDWTCTECEDGPQSHECPMPMTVIPLTEVA